MDEFELLQSYAARKAEDAFGSLTERYVNLVYSAAVRQMGNSDAAKDVTQAVFLTLAEKAGTISRKTALAGWLLRTTRYAAANARRLEQRRQHYEQQAMESYVESAGLDAVWRHIAPLLDEALDNLAEKDRDAVILRFFEQMPFKRIASRLGVSEDGAQKRVGRALDKLRLFFARHGRTVSVAALSSALVGNCVQAAPTAVAASVSALVVVPGALTGSFVVAVSHATLRAIAQARLRLFAIQAGGVALLLGIVALLVLRLGEPSAHKSPIMATPVAASPAPQAQAAAPVVPAAMDPLQNVGQLLLKVVDVQSGAPVANARLTLVSTAEIEQRTTDTFVTDVNGAARVAYSTASVKSWSHRIEIFRDGYVPKYVSWSEYQQDRIEEIPADYTVRLQSAVTIGGMVLDEQDGPVPDARVVFSVLGPVPSRSRERLTLMGDYHSEITAADGRWTCSHVPERFGMITFKPMHPLFQEMTWVTDSPDATPLVNVDKIAEADFLAGRALMRLKPGLAIAGVVSDESGRPVPDARVTKDFEFRRPLRSLLTDGDGSFQFRNGRPGNLFSYRGSGQSRAGRDFHRAHSEHRESPRHPAGRTRAARSRCRRRGQSRSRRNGRGGEPFERLPHAFSVARQDGRRRSIHLGSRARGSAIHRLRQRLRDTGPHQTYRGQRRANHSHGQSLKPHRDADSRAGGGRGDKTAAALRPRANLGDAQDSQRLLDLHYGA